MSSSYDPDIEILQMLLAWLKEASVVIEQRIALKEAAKASQEAASSAPPSFPPCPICGAEVTSYEFGSMDGPLVMKFRPCGSTVIRDPDVEI